jgi:DNA repair exonuclease SbcCD nuclease subunit
MAEPFRFLHLADLHLDTTFAGRTEAVRTALRDATRRAFEAAVTTAIEGRAHAVLLAGDVFDGDLLTFATERFLLDGCRRLGEAGITVVYCTGNHDPGAANQRVRALDWPDNVHLVFGARPQTIDIPGPGGEPVGRVVAAGHVRPREDRDLAEAFPAMDGDLPTVGLLHTQVVGAASAERHDAYAPSERADFDKPGYAYWALGHIHQRQRVFADLPVHYPGNLQGRHFRETGPKGGNWVEVAPFGLAEVSFVPLAPLEWQWVAVDSPAADNPDALAGELAGQVPASSAEQRLVRFDLSGTSPRAGDLHEPDNRAELEAALADRLGALAVEVRARDLHRPVDLDELRAAPSALATALELVAATGDDDALLDRLTPALLSGAAPSDADARRAYLRELLAGAEAELAERLVDPEAGP